jgi:malic enzyme
MLGENATILMVDRKGVIYKGRTEGMDQFKIRLRGPTKKRARWLKPSKAPTCSWACRPRAR